MSHRWPGVSALGVLDGEADALAGLCDRRGQSVVGYCECVCGPERAVEAASAAFAAFRAGAVRSNDPLSIEPDALLLGRTRAAAAQRAPKPAENLVFADVACSQIAVLLAESATGSLSPADRDRLQGHLARCVACRATQAIQQQAERAYFHPPEAALDAISRQAIIEALRRAVPLATPNGHRPGSTPAAVAAIQAASVAPASPRVAPQLPRTVPLSGSSSTSTPVGPSPGSPPPSPTTPPRQPARPLGTGGTAGGPPADLRSAGGQAGPDARDIAEQDTPPSGMPAASVDSPTGVMSAVEINAALGYEPVAGDPAGYADWHGSPDPGRAAGGRPLEDPDRPRRLALSLTSTGRDASRVSAARVLGPAAVLLVGLLIALFVAGVFNGGSHRTPTDPLAGAQTNPSVTLPSTGGVNASGAGSGSGSTAGASVGGSTGASSVAGTAASRRAAHKRAAALARRRKARTGSATTKTTSGATSTANATNGAGAPTTTKPTTSAPTATKPTTSAPTTNPASRSTPKKTTGGGGSTVHELGGTASAPPPSGVPAAGATGYQPG